MEIVVKMYYDNSIEKICIDNLKRCCYPILAKVMVDYKEEVFINKIKLNIQYSVCHFTSLK